MLKNYGSSFYLRLMVMRKYIYISWDYPWLLSDLNIQNPVYLVNSTQGICWNPAIYKLFIYYSETGNGMCPPGWHLDIRVDLDCLPVDDGGSTVTTNYIFWNLMELIYRKPPSLLTALNYIIAGKSNYSKIAPNLDFSKIL